MKAEQLAQTIHETRERLAPAYGLGPVRPWQDLPDAERQLAVAVAATVLADDETPGSPVQKVLDAWVAFCQGSTGTDYYYLDGDQRYRWAVAKVHADGVTTGGIFQEDRKVASFRIRADGRVERAPLPLRRALP